MKCCTLPDGDGRKDDGRKKGKGKHGKSTTAFAKAARSCKGKTGSAFWKCVNKHKK